MLDSIPFDGWLTGGLLVSGPSDSLQTDVSMWFRDGLVAGTPETHLRGRGTVSLGTEGGFGFDRFLLDSSDIDLATVRRVVPPLVVYALAQRQLVRGLTAGAVKG